MLRKHGQEQLMEDPEIRERAKPRRTRRWLHWLIALVIVALVLGTGRALMPWAVRNYVNRTLDKNQLYAGSIGPIEIHLWRGAYSIREMRISKRTGSVPVPLFAAKRIDFAIQWDALFHRKIVGRMLIDEPELNFVDAPTEGETQTGTGGPWLQLVQDLFPFDINRAVVRGGSIHFRAYQSKKPVDVYLSEVNGSVDNLTNIRREINPLVATVNVNGLMMDQAKLELKVTLDPFSYRPSFHLAMRLLGLDVTKINDLALAYGKFDFKRGWFDLVVEADAKEGQLNGYVKPLFRDLKVFSLKEDIKEDNVLQFFWQALVHSLTAIFKNQSRDQFGTLIRFTGSMEGKTSVDLLQTIGNVLRNAFIRAYLPKLEGGSDTVGGLTFMPADLSDPISAGDTQ